MDNTIQTKLHSSCEIDDFVENHIYLQAVGDSPIARTTGCVSLFKIYGQRLPSELPCSLYQSQEGGVGQSVRGNYKTRI